MIRRGLRYVFLAAMAALWLLVAALALEVGERARAYYAEVSYAGFFKESA